MWSRLRSRLSDEVISTLVRRAAAVINAPDQQVFIKSGKDFFIGESGQDNRDLLTAIHGSVWPEIRDLVSYQSPVVDHAILLIKGPGGSATNLHQDRPYWESRDPVPTIFSVWVALEAMTSEKGGLMLAQENEVPVAEISRFNAGTMIVHEPFYQNLDDGFPITIPDQVAKDMGINMELVVMEAGEAVAFDSFEPHMAAPNATGSPRLAMKIAYSEGADKNYPMCSTDELESD